MRRMAYSEAPIVVVLDRLVLLLMVLVLNAAVDVIHRRARKVGTWSS